MSKVEFLVNKGVEKHFNGQEVLFKVSSLNEHFEGLLIHESDAILVDGVEFAKVSDVNFDNATANEVAPKGDAEEVPLASGMTYAEAEELMNQGELIALPEWGGFWFKDIKTDEVVVLTKEGEITKTPWEECKERNDWVTVEATTEQKAILENYFAEEIEVAEQQVLTEETEDFPVWVNPEIEVVSETVTADIVPTETVVVEEIPATETIS
jgi:hypothetical protein